MSYCTSNGCFPRSNGNFSKEKEYNTVPNKIDYSTLKGDDYLKAINPSGSTYNPGGYVPNNYYSRNQIYR